MTNLDNVLKSRDITLPTKVHIVKVVVFPVVMYRCESWSKQKAEHWRTDAFELCVEKTFESPLDCRKIKPVNPKGNWLWLFIGRTDVKLKLQYFHYLMQRADSLEKTLMLRKTERRRRSGQQRKKWLDSITDSMDMKLSKLQEIVEDIGAWSAGVRGVTKSWTQLRDRTNTKWRMGFLVLNGWKQKKNNISWHNYYMKFQCQSL